MQPDKGFQSRHTSCFSYQDHQDSPPTTTMASASPVIDVEEEAKCPICLEVLTDPVTLDCGHKFCHGCIAECGETLVDLGAVECPVCRVRIKVTDAESKEVPQAASPDKATQPPPTMASAPPGTDMEEEAQCPICKELFTDPVTLNCGHNFCRGCITQYCDIWEREGKLECPACRDKIKGRNFRPNWQLANIAEKIRQRKKHLCVKHQEENNLFCKEDVKFVCMTCWSSPEHELHTVLSLEKAGKEYKENIQEQLQSLEKKREELVEQKVAEEQRIQECLKQLEVGKQEIISVFKEMRKLLEEQERSWLTQLADLEKEIKERQEENMTRLTEEISHFGDLMKDVEEKCQQAPSEFLQDIGCTLNRCQEGRKREKLELYPELEWRVRSFGLKCSALKRAKEQFEGSLEKAPSKAKVTLDPDSANRFLILSEDLKSVRWGYTYQDLPNNPERFDMSCVLGRESFTSGRHCWEVEVQKAPLWKGWAVGVAGETLRRKGIVVVSPHLGVWAVGKDKSQHHPIVAFTTLEWTPLTLSHEPRKIRVFLDYEEGRVEFFDADTDRLIFTFPPALFSGKKIHPFFRVESGVCLNAET